MTPPPVTGVPVGRPVGMTTLENVWVSGLSRDMETYRARLDLHHQSIDILMAILNTNSGIMDRAMDVITVTRGVVRRLYIYLALMLGVLVMMIGLIVWWIMH